MLCSLIITNMNLLLFWFSGWYFIRNSIYLFNLKFRYMLYIVIFDWVNIDQHLHNVIYCVGSLGCNDVTILWFGKLRFGMIWILCVCHIDDFLLKWFFYLYTISLAKWFSLSDGISSDIIKLIIRCYLVGE